VSGTGSGSDVFRAGVTRDFLGADGATLLPGVSFGLLDEAPGLEWEYLPENVAEITPELAARYDAILTLRPRYTAASVGGADKRLALIARFGVGYDRIDVDACTRNGVLVSITPEGVRRPVAQAVLTFIVALAGRLMEKDRVTRAGDWQRAGGYTGMGVTGRTLGLIGLGNIGRDVVRLVAPFEMRVLAHDPYARREDLPAGVDLADLETLLRESDFVSVNCPLTPETRHLVGAPQLGQMKPTAYLINTARGPIVDERALYEALAANRIAGAGLDVFEQEPTPADNPLFGLDNVIVTPHALCWTDECLRGNGEGACRAILALARGEVPRHVVNPAALEHPWLARRIEAWRSRRGGT
jgi:phosphoglycerate dehydrogenase-like enzyme